MQVRGVFISRALRKAKISSRCSSNFDVAAWCPKDISKTENGPCAMVTVFQRTSGKPGRKDSMVLVRNGVSENLHPLNCRREKVVLSDLERLLITISGLLIESVYGAQFCVC